MNEQNAANPAPQGRYALTVALSENKILEQVYALSAWHGRQATTPCGELCAITPDNIIVARTVLTEALGTLRTRLAAYLKEWEYQGDTIKLVLWMGKAYGAAALQSVAALAEGYFVNSVLAEMLGSEPFPTRRTSHLHGILSMLAR